MQRSKLKVGPKLTLNAIKYLQSQISVTEALPLHSVRSYCRVLATLRSLSMEFTGTDKSQIEQMWNGSLFKEPKRRWLNVRVNFSDRQLVCMPQTHRGQICNWRPVREIAASQCSCLLWIKQSNCLHKRCF